MEEIEIKRSGFAPELNPFLVEPVLVKLLKLVDSVSELKELRLMCQTWDEFNLKEIGDRAFKGKLKAIDFCWTKKSAAEEEFNKFIEETLPIRQIFYSFKFNFPESWAIFSNHLPGFFYIYPAAFVHLSIPFDLGYIAQDQIRELFVKFMESDIWVNFKKITISKIGDSEKFGLFNASSFFVPSSGNIQKKLQKLDIKDSHPMILKIFESDFATGKYTNLTSMVFAKLEKFNLEFPGLDPSKLTRLEIVQPFDKSLDALEFTITLNNLARNGMILKKFRMNFNLTLDRSVNIDESFFENLRLICFNLTQFLSSQYSTLESLHFEVVCSMENAEDVPDGAEIWAKIHLPTFEVLHSLRLKVDFQLMKRLRTFARRTFSKLIALDQDLTVHFPKLVNLTLINESSLDALRVNPPPFGLRQLLQLRQAGQNQLRQGQLHLESFEILQDYPGVWKASFDGLFGSVKALKCPAKLLKKRLPLDESLRQLHIFDLNLGFHGQIFLKLNHFKKLERLTISINRIQNRRIKKQNHSNRHAEDLMATFKEATELALTSITFIGPNMEEWMKKDFIKYFPFLVEFKEP